MKCSKELMNDLVGNNNFEMYRKWENGKEKGLIPINFQNLVFSPQYSTMIISYHALLDF